MPLTDRLVDPASVIGALAVASASPDGQPAVDGNLFGETDFDAA